MINQEDMFGKFLPSIFFDRITLESSELSELRVGLELSIKYKRDNDPISLWFSDDKFKKYIKIKVIQSIDPLLTKSITNKTKHISEVTSDDGASITDLTIDNAIAGADDLTKYSHTDSDGNTILDVNFRTDFTLGERNPEHLAYFIFASIDFDEMSTEYGIDFDEDTLTKQNGRISSEIVIDNYKTVGMMTQFYTESGVLWEGSVHKMPSEERDIWMTGPGHSQGSEYLTIQKVPNNKIQDFRHVEDIKRYSADFTFTSSAATTLLGIAGTRTSAIHEVQKLAQNKLRSLKSDNMEPKRKEAYFSDIYLTKDMNNNAKFTFAVDYKKLLMDTSVFKKLYETASGEAEKLINYSRIRSLSVKRRRVIEQKTKNKLGSEMTGEVLFDIDTPIETILTSSDRHHTGDFKEIQEDNVGGLKEESFSVIAGNGPAPSQYGIRHFSAYDKTISGITSGLYQYGIEITVEERTAEYLKERLDELILARKAIHTYYLDATKLGMTKYLTEVSDPHIDHELERSIDITKSIGNYNPASNRFTEEFIAQHSETIVEQIKNWIRPYWATMILLTPQITDALASIVQQNIWLHAGTATPKSIMAVINLFDDLISKLNNLIGLDSDSKTLLSSTTRIEYWFKNNELDASEPKNIGYDYLSTNSDYKGSDYVREIAYGYYITRVMNEHSYYFNGMKSNKAEYLSPNFCHFNKSTDRVTMSQWITNSLLASRIMNYNINRKTDMPKENTPIDKFKSSITSVYAHLGLTIERTHGRDVDESTYPNGNPTNGVTATNLYRSLMAGFVVQGINNEDNNESPFIGIPSSVIPPTNSKEAGIKTWQSAYEDAHWNVHKTLPSSSTTQILLSCGMRADEVRRIYSENIHDLGTLIWDNLPPQLLSLRPYLGPTPDLQDDVIWDVHSENEDPTKGVKASTFQFRYNRINAIEYLVGYEDASGDSRIKNPIWESLTGTILQTLPSGSRVMCRMRKFECQTIGIKHSKALKLPVYDNYFILMGGSPNQNNSPSTGQDSPSTGQALINLTRNNN